MLVLAVAELPESRDSRSTVRVTRELEVRSPAATQACLISGVAERSSSSCRCRQIGTQVTYELAV